jgi:hypothetical protein
MPSVTPTATPYKALNSTTYFTGMMDVTAANVSTTVVMSSHDGHVGFDATNPYIEVSSSVKCAAEINCEWYTHDSLIGGCIITKRRPVATTRTRNLFADCKEILKYDQLVQHQKNL